MIRRLNFTHRKRINREHLEISLGRSATGAIEFDASFDLAPYDLPTDANVFVEAYRRTTVMRFPVGTVAELKLPDVRELSEFGRPEGILFRVKVSSSEPDRGKLLAEADRISFRLPEETQEEQIPLMPVEAAELGAAVWMLDFTDEPVLLVNDKFGDWREIVRSEIFITLVLPEALRQVLTRILMIEKLADDDDEYKTWQGNWVRFTQNLPGIDPLPDLDEEQSVVERWIEDVVKIFSEKSGMFERFASYWAQEVDE